MPRNALRSLIAVAGFVMLFGCQLNETNDDSNESEVETPATTMQQATYEIETPTSLATITPTSAEPVYPLPTLPPSAGGYEAAITGLLIERDDCLLLRPDPGEGNRDSLIVWPFGYFADRDEGTIAVRDSDGTVVAREGTRIYLGGGGERAGEQFAQCQIESLWIANSPIFIVDESPIIYDGDDRPVPTHSGTFTTKPETISGYLLESGPCLWIVSDNAFATYQVIWPPGYTSSLSEGSLVVLNSEGDIAARVEEHNTLHGSPADPTVFQPICEGLVWLAVEPIFPNYNGPPQ